MVRRCRGEAVNIAVAAGDMGGAIATSAARTHGVVVRGSRPGSESVAAVIRNSSTLAVVGRGPLRRTRAAVRRSKDRRGEPHVTTARSAGVTGDLCGPLGLTVPLIGVQAAFFCPFVDTPRLAGRLMMNASRYVA